MHPSTRQALYDGQLVDAHFTRSFYKHMLGQVGGQMARGWTGRRGGGVCHAGAACEAPAAPSTPPPLHTNKHKQTPLCPMQPLTHEDIEAVDPDFYKNLRWVCHKWFLL